jgi:uncharacterized protein YndB with AHSA1/START domain
MSVIVSVFAAIGVAYWIARSFTLTATSTGTHLRVEQSGFRADQPKAFGGAKFGWQKFLENLDQLLARND